MNYKNAVEDLLFSKEDYFRITRGIDFMYDVYSKATHIEAGDLTNQHMIKTEKGWIVTPTHAAHCLKELMRTTKFLRGIHQAIEERISVGKKVKILYAGCGPYATLLTPFTALYSADQLSFTLLDFNPISVDAVCRLYDFWNLNDYLETTIVADATSVELDLKRDYDIIISETMQNSLNNECQVPLTRNMVRFLNPEGTFIPQNVTIDAYFVGSKNTEKPKATKKLLVGRAYDLDYKKIPEIGHSIKFKIPQTDFEYLTLYTEIRVYKEIMLEPYDCSLTLPLIKDRFIDKPKTVTFDYIEGEKPRMEAIYEYD